MSEHLRRVGFGGTYRNPQPSDEAVVSLKSVVVVASFHQNSATSTQVGRAVSLANPWKSADDGDDDEHVGDDARRNYRGVLDRVVAQNVDDLEDEPPRRRLAPHSFCQGRDDAYPAPESAHPE